MSKIILLPIIVLIVFEVQFSYEQASNFSEFEAFKINGTECVTELPTNGSEKRRADEFTMDRLAEFEGLDYGENETFVDSQPMVNIRSRRSNQTEDLFSSQYQKLYGPKPKIQMRSFSSLISGPSFNPPPMSPDYTNDFKRIKERLESMLRLLDVPETDPIAFSTALQEVVITGVAVFSIVISIVNTVMSIYTIYDAIQIGAKLNTITNQLSMQITMIDRGFFNIERKLDLLAEEVEDIASKSEFKRNQANVKNLNTLFIRFLHAPFEHTMDDLKRECAANYMLVFAQYIVREIQSNNELSLKTMMTRRNDLRKFGTWAKLIGQSLTKAMFLHGYCLGVRITDNTTMKAVVSHDKKVFFNAIKELEEFIRTGAKQIKKDYMRFVGQEVRTYAQKHREESHQDFSRHVHDILREKYFYRYWYVLSYSGTTYGSDYHEFATGPNTFSWVRQLNRCVYIASTNSRVDVNDKLKDCIAKHKNSKRNWYWSAGSIWEDMNECVKPYNGFIVVRGSEDAKATFSAGTYAYVWTKRDMVIFHYTRDYVVRLIPTDIVED